jgi:flagellar motor switch protein FliM
MSAQQRFFSSKVLSGDSAMAVESYDLFGNERQKQACIQTYAPHRRAISAYLQEYLLQLFNGAQCEVSMSGFNLVTPKIRPAEKSNKLWLKATLAGQPEAAFLAMDVATLHAFSVLFLGGVLREPVKELDTATLTETEYRLAFQLLKQLVRAFHSTQEASKQAEIACEVITADALPAQGWLLTTSFAIIINGHTFNWHFWWPVSEEAVQTSKITPAAKNLIPLLTTIPVRLRIVLSEQSLPLNMMANLSVGDVLPLELPDPTPALIGDNLCLEGRIAEHRGSLVYQITNLKSS